VAGDKARQPVHTAPATSLLHAPAVESRITALKVQPCLCTCLKFKQPCVIVYHHCCGVRVQLELAEKALRFWSGGVDRAVCHMVPEAHPEDGGGGASAEVAALTMSAALARVQDLTRGRQEVGGLARR